MTATSAPTGYRDVITDVLSMVDRRVPSGSVVLVASKGDPDLIAFDHHLGRHLPGTDDGRYAGHHPSSGDDAVAALETARRCGADYLVIPSTCAWWLEHYPPFRDRLESSYRLLDVGATGSMLWDLGTDSSWLHIELRRLVRTLLPPDDPVIVIGGCDPELTPNAIPLPLSAGRGALDVQAFMEAARAGARWLVIPAADSAAVRARPSLRGHLDQTTNLVLEEEGLCEIRSVGRHSRPLSATVRRACRQRGTVLYIAHGHPAERAGGAEQYALELHEAMNADGPYDSVLLTRAPGRRGPVGGVVEPARPDGSAWRIHTDDFGFDHLTGTCRDKRLYTQHLRPLIKAIEPTVVHVQHLQYIGYEALREIRRSAPQAAIVMTLHDFLPICHRNGQLVRASDESLCRAPDASSCTGCFPDISESSFAQRRAFIQAQLGLVDAFVAPSTQLAAQYENWGIDRTRVFVEDYGRRHIGAPLPPASPERNRFGFFGQITPFKGLHVLLEAMAQLADRHWNVPPVLKIHGANLEHQSGEFQRTIRGLLDRSAPLVENVGPYDAEDLPGLMANIDWVVVPSVWRENSPLVIQEAFAFGRPVICSDIGGMAEKVRDGVDGLHARCGDSDDLARVIMNAASSADQWDLLRANIPDVPTMDGHVDRLTDLYVSLGREGMAK